MALSIGVLKVTRTPDRVAPESVSQIVERILQAAVFVQWALPL
jgi:hypothetical protein